MIRVARMMYGLPVELNRSKNCPLGYDSIRVIDGVEWAWPNDKAFKLLVQAKHLMKQSSTRKVAGWLDRELRKIGYNFNRLKNQPQKGKYRNHTISHTAIDTLLKYRTPMDECVLDLDERERIFKVEAESAFVSLAHDGTEDGKPADTGLAETSERCAGTEGDSTEKDSTEGVPGNTGT